LETPRRNRGKHPNDDRLFGPKWLPVFREAVSDLSFLLSRSYGENAALALVGNRYRLNKRQRMAVLRMSASDEEVALRKQKECTKADLKDASIEIDGFNLLILLENLLSGAYIFKGRDHSYRDISSVHGSYKRVAKTRAAIEMTGELLRSFQPFSVTWYLDRPVSNSGRLKQLLLEVSEERDFGWEVELVNDPDKVLAVSKAIVVSSDSWVLNEAARWFNLGACLVEQLGESANVVDGTLK
jgi:hypothetical protein